MYPMWRNKTGVRKVKAGRCLDNPPQVRILSNRVNLP